MQFTIITNHSVSGSHKQVIQEGQLTSWEDFLKVWNKIIMDQRGQKISTTNALSRPPTT